MVAARIANLNHGQKKSDVEISTTQTEAGGILNISRESVISAKKVLDQGSEELINKVDGGEIAVSKSAMYLQCYTAEEIAEVVGIADRSVSDEISQLTAEMEQTSKTAQTANFQDDFQVPIYNRFSY